MNAIAHPRAEGAASDSAANFGRGWIPQSRDIGLPGEAVLGDRADGAGGYGAPLDGMRWTAAIKVRFLHCLAGHGNVRVAAAAVGLSRQGAYLARRRDAVFAKAWDAALGLARRHAEGVLAERALDGVVEDVWFRGELVGSRRRYDGRLLLAHLARLDRAVAQGAAVSEGGFDRLLAEIAGLNEAGDVAALGPSRDAMIEVAVDAAISADEDDGFVMPEWAAELADEEAAEEEAARTAENAAIAAAAGAAGARWDGAWAGLYAAVDALAGAQADAAMEAPMEYKALGLGALEFGATAGPAFPQDTVKCVKQSAAAPALGVAAQQVGIGVPGGGAGLGAGSAYKSTLRSCAISSGAVRERSASAARTRISPSETPIAIR